MSYQCTRMASRRSSPTARRQLTARSLGQAAHAATSTSTPTPRSTRSAATSPTSKRDLHVLHTSCILGGVPADETRSTSPGGPPPGPVGRLLQPLQLRTNAVPTSVRQLPTASTLPQLAQHSPASGRGVQHGFDVRVDGDLGLHVPDRDRTAVSRPAFLRRRAAASRRAPPPGPAGTPRQPLTDQSAAPGTPPGFGRRRAHRPLSCSSPSVQAITVADRQRTCLPTRNPCGP